MPRRANTQTQQEAVQENAAVQADAGAGYGSKASWDAGTGRTADGDGRNVTG